MNNLKNEIVRLDKKSGFINFYNTERCGQDAKYKLHDEFDPCPIEGDINNAHIVMLLANPGFGVESKQEIEFINDGQPGWPLAGLHKAAPKELGEKWWRLHLKGLVDVSNEGESKEGRFQIISQRVAALQLVPWASKNFDYGLIESKKFGPLPSNELMLNEAEKVLERPDTIVLLMRCESHWRRSPKINHLLESHSQRRIFIPNTFRRPYVSKGNFSKPAWEAIIEAINQN